MTRIICGAFFLASWMAPALAQDYCGIVLQSGAFDRTSLNESEFILRRERDRLCDNDYSSVEEARNSATNSGFSLGFRGLSMGDSRARQKSNGRWEIRDTEFCQASSADFESAYGRAYEEEVASIAVAAWLSCVESAQSSQLFLNYELRNGGDILAGTLVRYMRQRTTTSFRVTGIGVAGDAAEHIRCRVGNQWFDSVELENIDYVVESTETVLTCEKMEEGRGQHATISIQTSQGAIPPIDMPSSQAIEEDRIDQLAARLRELDDRFASFPAVGTVFASSLSLEQFMETVPPGQKWAQADGMNGAPLVRRNVGGLTLEKIVSGVLDHGQNVSELVGDADADAEWHWIVANNDTRGNRTNGPPGHFEWSEDHFQHFVNNDGIVIAQGRTFNWAVGGHTPAVPSPANRGWSNWLGGKANVLGVATSQSTPLNHFVRVE